MTDVDLLQGAEALASQIAARATEIERLRRLPADLARELASSGLFRCLRPAALHGLQCEPAQALSAIERVSMADASVGWCVMIAATTGLAAARLAPAAAHRIYPDALTVTGGVFAPMGRAVDCGDSWLVTGRWKWASGSTHCQWFSGGCLIEEDADVRRHPDGSPQVRMMYFPIEQATLHDTWHVAGLCGTGSGDIEVTDLRIPKDQSVSLTHDLPWCDAALYRFPVFGLLALGIAAVMSGNALAAIEDLKTLARTKQPAGSRRTLAERAAVQSQLAQSEAALEAAREFMKACVQRSWRAACDGEALSVRARADLRMAATHAVRVSADVIRAMYDLAGGASVFSDSPLQRRFRDAHVGTQHMMVSGATWELAGRVSLGLTVDATLL